MSSYFEIIGLVGLLLLASSFMMRNIKILRIMYLCGSLVFGVYGVLIQSLSVILLNVFTAGINAYHLFNLHKENSRKETFDILSRDPKTDDYLKRFILFHAQDIMRYFPSFDPNPETGTLVGSECFLILRGTLPVSLIAFRRNDNGEIEFTYENERYNCHDN